MTTSHNNGPGSYVVYPRNPTSGKHTTRSIIDRLEGNGYEWVCECGEWSPTGFATYDEAWTDWHNNHPRNDETAPDWDGAVS